MQKGFVLIELLVVISIIGLVSSVAAYSVNMARKNAHDNRRIADMKQIQIALELYLNEYGTYPAGEPEMIPGYNCYGIDTTVIPPFIPQLRNAGFLAKDPIEPNPNGVCDDYGPWNYYQYNLMPAGAYGCDPARGRYYVLGMGHMETIHWPNPHPDNPGWKCDGNWGSNGTPGDIDAGPIDYAWYGNAWVTGNYEK